MKIAVYRYLVTLIVVAVAAGAAWFLQQKYVRDPWTRDCQVRANIVGIAPRVAGPIINIPVHDNQEVRAGDLLFEIDPADYKTIGSDSPKRFPVRVQITGKPPIPLRIGQTVTIAVLPKSSTTSTEISKQP